MIFHLQEANYLQNVVAKIVSYKPDIILVEKSIAFLARKYLQVSFLPHTLSSLLIINVLLNRIRCYHFSRVNH